MSRDQKLVEVDCLVLSAHGVVSVCDLFHPVVSRDAVDEAFARMALTTKHNYHLLTKHPERMAEYLADNGFASAKGGPMRDRVEMLGTKLRPTRSDEPNYLHTSGPWPVPNVRLGTVVEDDAAAAERIPHLLACPAALRFLACEPLRGPLDLWKWFGGECSKYPAYGGAIDWVIVGGDLGPMSQPCHVDWVRNIIIQCRAAGVPCFVKHLGLRAYSDTEAGQ